MHWRFSRSPTRSRRSIVRSASSSTSPQDVGATRRSSTCGHNRYLGQYGRPEASGGWHFLTGSQQNIRAVADAIGFTYN